MKNEEGQGFLSDKFEDWGSEPIPNGWFNIDRQIAADRRRRPAAIWFSVPLILAFLGSAYYFNNLVHTKEAYVPSPVAEASGLTEGPKNEIGAEELSNNSSKSSVQNSTKSSEFLEDVTQIGTRNSLADNGNESKENSSSILNPSKTEYNKRKEGIRKPKALHIAGIQINKPNTRASGSTLEFGKEHLVLNDPLIESVTENSQLKTTESENSIEAHNGKNENFSHVASDENSSEKSIGSTVPERQNSEVAFMENRWSKLTPIGLPRRPVPLLLKIEDNPFPIINKGQTFKYSVGFIGGYAPRSISIDQSQTEQHVQVSNSGSSAESWFGAAGIQAQNEVSSWLSSFVSLNLGLFRQEMNLSTTSKEPVSYEMAAGNDYSYSFKPKWEYKTEKRRQDLIFGTLEFGLKPILIKSLESGPFASAVVWVALSQTHSSSLGASSASFVNTNENVALSYRLGYQHTFFKKYRAEIFTAGLPDKILVSTKGLSIKPQLIGIGLNYIIR